MFDNASVSDNTAEPLCRMTTTPSLADASVSLAEERAANKALRQELENTRNALKLALAKLKALRQVLDDRNKRISGLWGPAASPLNASSYCDRAVRATRLLGGRLSKAMEMRN